MRYDLAFFVCCCKSFLPPNRNRSRPHTTSSSDNDENDTNEVENGGNYNTDTDSNDDRDYYTILGISHNATIDDIKRAYKKQSLLYHPDKLAQRNIPMTAQIQKQYNNIKEAYDILSDDKQREIYNIVQYNKKTMKYIQEPYNINPNEILQNFIQSSIIDRCKIFAIFLVIAFLLFIQPILICLHIDNLTNSNHPNQQQQLYDDDVKHMDDGHEEQNDNNRDQQLWVVTLIPLWIYNGLILLYHIYMIFIVGPMKRPEHLPNDVVWIDPLPMSKRYMSFARFALIVLFEVLLILRWDNVLLPYVLPYYIIFVPFYVWEGIILYKKYPMSITRIVTIHDLEVALGKPFSEFTMAEKKLIVQRYSVVTSIHSAEYDIAYAMKIRAKQDIQQSILRILFVLLLIVQLDVLHVHTTYDLNYFIVFLPIFIMICSICCTNYATYMDVRNIILEKDPTIVAGPNSAGITTGSNPATTTTASNNDDDNPLSNNYGTLNDDNNNNKKSNYHGTTTAAATLLTDEEREQLRHQYASSQSKMISKCCTQCCFFLVLILIVCKLQFSGIHFSTFYILSPFLLLAGIILCCIGCAIFGITEVPTSPDGIYTFPPNQNGDTPTKTANEPNSNNNDSNFHYMNAAETGTAKPNNDVKHTTATNIAATSTIIIPPAPISTPDHQVLNDPILVPVHPIDTGSVQDDTRRTSVSADHRDTTSTSSPLLSLDQEGSKNRNNNATEINELD